MNLMCRGPKGLGNTQICLAGSLKFFWLVSAPLEHDGTTRLHIHGINSQTLMLAMSCHCRLTMHSHSPLLLHSILDIVGYTNILLSMFSSPVNCILKLRGLHPVDDSCTLGCIQASEVGNIHIYIYSIYIYISIYPNQIRGILLVV